MMEAAPFLADFKGISWLFWWQVPLCLLVVVVPVLFLGVVLLIVGIAGKNRGLRKAGLIILICLAALFLLAAIALAVLLRG